MRGLIFWIIYIYAIIQIVNKTITYGFNVGLFAFEFLIFVFFTFIIGLFLLDNLLRFIFKLLSKGF